MPYVPDTTTSDVQAVGSASAVMSPTMGEWEVWRFISTTNCYIAQGSAPVAAAADGSMFWPANVPLDLSGRMGSKLAVIQASAGGTASLTRVNVVV